MSNISLELLNDIFSIHRLSLDSKIPEQVFTAPIFFIAKTYDEVSIVLPSSLNIKSDNVENDWQALRVVGPLDFNLTGILADISKVLANEEISIFAISTFDTDYILVKSDNIAAAITALQFHHYQVKN